LLLLLEAAFEADGEGLGVTAAGDGVTAGDDGVPPGDD
jgi:hypothetical protein